MDKKTTPMLDEEIKMTAETIDELTNGKGEDEDGVHEQ